MHRTETMWVCINSDPREEGEVNSMVGPLTFGEKYRPELSINRFSEASHIKNNSSVVSERQDSLNLKKIELSLEKEKALMRLYFMTIKVSTYAKVPSPLEILNMRAVQREHLRLNGQSLEG